MLMYNVEGFIIILESDSYCTHTTFLLSVYVNSFLPAFLPHPDYDVFMVVLADSIHKLNASAR